ncbi:MAG TPA: nuclease A inhibitor family protein [Pyrinomonadaceae bacterium]|nr:nuclease A inhibitor family protein [Pyrinomonadaceae bacterium]
MQDFFQENNNISNELSAMLATACDGLIYISEMDAPVTPFFGSAAETVTGETILQQANLPRDSPVTELSLEAFFGRLTEIRDWYGDVEKLRAKKFSELQKLLGENLSDPKVFRVGLVQVDIFTVGIDRDGRIAGVTTKAVET